MSLVREDIFEPDNETDQRGWFTVEEAVSRLQYSTERALVTRNHNGGE
jgi:hypothetical protein